MAKFLKQNTPYMEILEHICYAGVIRLQDIEVFSVGKGSTSNTYARYLNWLAKPETYKIKKGRSSIKIYEGVVLRRYGMRGSYRLSRRFLPVLKTLIPEAVEFYEANYLDSIKSDREKAVRTNKVASIYTFVSATQIPFIRENIEADTAFYPIKAYREDVEEKARLGTSKTVGVLKGADRKYVVYREFGKFRTRSKAENKTIVNMTLQNSDNVRRAILIGENYEHAKQTITAWIASDSKTRTDLIKIKPLSEIFDLLYFLPDDAEGVELCNLIPYGIEDLAKKIYGQESIRSIFDQESDTEIITVMPIFDISRMIKICTSGYKPDKTRKFITTRSAAKPIREMLPDTKLNIEYLTTEQIKDFLT